MAVARNGITRREPFKPHVVVGVQPALIVVDENGSGDVHGVYEREALLNAAIPQGNLDLGCNVEKRPPSWRFEPKLLAIRLHRLCFRRDYAVPPRGCAAVPCHIMLGG